MCQSLDKNSPGINSQQLKGGSFPFFSWKLRHRGAVYLKSHSEWLAGPGFELGPSELRACALSCIHPIRPQSTMRHCEQVEKWRDVRRKCFPQLFRNTP